MIPHNRDTFNPKFSTSLEILTAWAELRRHEAAAPAWHREAIARRRMALLVGYPERDIPHVIDELNRLAAEETFA